MPTKRTIQQLYDLFEPGQPDASITPDRVQDLIATALVADKVLVVRSLSDLPAVSANEILLPADKTVMVLENINLGSAYLRMQQGTVLRGLAGATITSTTAGGVVRSSDTGSAVILREINVLAPNGPCLNVAGSNLHQFNVFFCGLFGAKAASVNGFDVAAFKDCFIQAADGITFGGDVGKVFVSACPFYGITSGNAAIEFSADLECERADIVTCWWKDVQGTAIRAQSGYDLTYGRVTNAMFEDVGQLLDGISIADNNWWFRDNDGLESSRAIADSRLSAPATTVITTQGQWTPLNGTFTLASTAERFTSNGDDELVYTGRDPVRVLATVAIAASPPANTTWQFAITKNGVVGTGSIITVVQGGGVAAQPRTVTVVAVLRLEAGDSFKLACRNQTNTSDLPVANVSYAASD